MLKNLLAGLIIVALAVAGCGGGSSQALQPISQVDLDRNTITVKANKEQALNAIIHVMTSYGYNGTSVTPQLAVFEKQLSSGTYKAFWGHGKTIRAIFLISQEGNATKIRGDIKGVVRGNVGIAGSFAPGDNVVDSSGNEKYQQHLQELLGKIKAELAPNS